MLTNRLLYRPTRRTSRGGFTLVELLVVIGIIAILAGVALGPITSGINKAKQSTGMQNARSIGLLCFQFSIDNDSTYPAGSVGGVATPTATGVAVQLLQGKYATDPSIFYVAGPGKTKYTTPNADFSSLGAANVSWDFTVQTNGGNGTISGITSSSSDLLPVVFCSGNGKIAYPAPNTGLDLTLQANNIYQTAGIAVCYKSNSAKFMVGSISGSGAIVKNFIDPSYNDTTAYQNLEP